MARNDFYHHMRPLYGSLLLRTALRYTAPSRHFSAPPSIGYLERRKFGLVDTQKGRGRACWAPGNAFFLAASYGCLNLVLALANHVPHTQLGFGPADIIHNSHWLAPRCSVNEAEFVKDTNRLYYYCKIWIDRMLVSFQIFREYETVWNRYLAKNPLKVYVEVM